MNRQRVLSNLWAIETIVGVLPVIVVLGMAIISYHLPWPIGAQQNVIPLTDKTEHFGLQLLVRNCSQFASAQRSPAALRRSRQGEFVG